MDARVSGRFAEEQAALRRVACDTGMHVKLSDLERATRDAVAQWAADIDAAARDRAQQAARDSAHAAVARLDARDGGVCGRLRRLALERVADAEAGGILGDDAWGAALALCAEHTRILGNLGRARAAAATGPSADSIALLPDLDLLAKWDMLPASALNAILRTVVRRVAVYRQSPRRQGSDGRWVSAENGFEVLPVWEDDPWEGKMPQRGQRTST